MVQSAFECLRCNQCCHGEGGISLAADELPAAAAILGLDAREFALRYCDERDGSYHIRVNDNGDCCLLGPQGCLIHQAKPRICRRWPYFKAMLKDAGAFEEAKLCCPGLTPQASHQDFLDQYQAENNEKDK